MTPGTRPKILLAARRILHDKGAAAVTMRRVGVAAGITAMAIYRHFPDRDALLGALADEGFQQLAGMLAAVPEDQPIAARMDGLLEATLDFALTNLRLFELMFLQPRPGARQFPQDFAAGRSPTANPFIAVVREGIDSGYFRDDDPVAIMFDTGALLQGLVLLYAGGRMRVSEEEFRGYCRRSMQRYFHGIRT